jgi:hypothetical protein
MSNSTSSALVEEARQAIVASRVILARVRQRTDSVVDLRAAGNAFRLIQESQRCLRRLRIMVDTHAAVFGQNHHGTAKGDAAFRGFLEKLAYWP